MPSIYKTFFGSKGERYLGKAGVGPKSYLQGNPAGPAAPVGRLQKNLNTYRRAGQRETRLQGILADQQQPYANAFYQKQLNDIQAKKASLGGWLQNRSDILQSRLGNVPVARGNRIANRIGRIDQALLPPAPAPPTPAPTPDIPGAIPGTVPGAPGVGGNLTDMLGQYTAPASGVEGPYQNYLTSSLSRMNAIPTPSFEDQYSRWRDVADREANRQNAQLSEALGARGARYGSDILTAQSDLRQKQTQDLASKADEIQRLLNDQRIQESGQNQNAALGFGQLENQRRSQGLGLLFADYLRRTAPPPLLAAGGQFSSGAGFGDAIVGG